MLRQCATNHRGRFALSNNKMWTHYDNLKVARNAPPAVIKAAYRALSQQYHPDRNPAPEAQQIMRLINGAYDVLGDPARRAEYDRELAAREKEEKLVAQRKAAVRKDDDPAAIRTQRRSPSPVQPPPPAPPSTTSRSALPPVWARVLLCVVLFAIGVWFTWRDEVNTTASHDVPDAANTSSPWVTPAHAPSPEVAALASGTSVPAPVRPAVDLASVPTAVDPAPVLHAGDPASIPPAASPTPAPPAVNPAPMQAAPVHHAARPPVQPPTRPPVHPATIQSAPPQSTPTVSDAEFIAMMKIQEPDFDRIIRDPDWNTYLQWHEGTTTIGQIATNAFNRRDMKISVKIFETFKLAKTAAVSSGIPFPKLMEYEDQLIRNLPKRGVR